MIPKVMTDQCAKNLAQITNFSKETIMGLLLLIVLVLLLFGSAPRWGYSREWGYGPSGIVGLLLIILLVLLVVDVVPWGWHAGPAVVVR
jgi:sterol desaturase/sphingolipid hydroxylase (fatty acid hydroxylase superfamily)